MLEPLDVIRFRCCLASFHRRPPLEECEGGEVAWVVIAAAAVFVVEEKLEHLKQPEAGCLGKRPCRPRCFVFLWCRVTTAIDVKIVHW